MDTPIDIKIKDIASMTVAFINMKGDFGQIPSAFEKLYSWIKRKNYKPAGPAIAIFHNIPGEVPGEELRWELRSQISDEVPEVEADSEGLGIKRLGDTKVATVIYKGSYENTEPLYIALNHWIDTNGYVVNGPPEELYYNDPELTGKEPITEIRLPIKKK